MAARILLALALLGIATGGAADEGGVSLSEVAEAIREGRIDVGAKYSVDPRDGRLHVIHADVLGMECSSCHFGTTYRPDYLLIGKDDPYPPRAKGRYDRTACLGCHREGGVGRAFYGASARSE